MKITLEILTSMNYVSFLLMKIVDFTFEIATSKSKSLSIFG